MAVLLSISCAVTYAGDHSAADKDWLKLQCDERHAAQDCLNALNQTEGRPSDAAVRDTETPSFEEKVERCVKFVNEKNPYGRFDAYAMNGRTVNMFGSASDRFQFSKCMYKLGIDLSISAPPQ